MAAAAAISSDALHIPVLLRPLLEAVAPVAGHWLDATFGAGGYTRGLLDAGAEHVTAIDRDPMAFDLAATWLSEYGEKITCVQSNFSQLDDACEDLDGVVMDLGVSSMQLDQSERGFSFMKDGPLDMRMSQEGPSAADIVNEKDEAELADIIYLFGEERAARRIARSLVRARQDGPIETTAELSQLVEGCLPRAKPGQSHPATRTFQAIRIAVNNEYGELASGLEAAERALKPGGKLAVVSFHSVEDRMVKRFFQDRSATTGGGSRYAPEMTLSDPAFTLKSRKAIGPDDRELAENPRARSAKLRVAVRTDAPAGKLDHAALGMPMLKGNR